MSGIVWWEIETPNPKLFQQFHSALSGWTFEPAFKDTELRADYWIIQHDGQSIGGLQQAPSEVDKPLAGTRVYLTVDDLEGTLARVIELGGTIERSRVELGGNDRWFGILQDPTGVSLGLWTQNPPLDRHEKDAFWTVNPG